MLLPSSTCSLKIKNVKDEKTLSQAQLPRGLRQNQVRNKPQSHENRQLTPPHHRREAKGSFTRTKQTQTQYPERTTELSTLACSRDKGGILQDLESVLPAIAQVTPERSVPVYSRATTAKGVVTLYKTAMEGLVTRNYEVEQSGNFSSIKKRFLEETLFHSEQVGFVTPSGSVCHLPASASRAPSKRPQHRNVVELTYRFVKKTNPDIVFVLETLLDDRVSWNYEKITWYFPWIRQKCSTTS